MTAGIILDRLAFTGTNDAFAALDFRRGPNLVYGASNTGKSFACKAVDFMLGGQRELPDIAERRPYDRVLLTLTLPAAGQITLASSISGGAYTMAPGMLDRVPDDARKLARKHDADREDNLSSVLLKELALYGKQIAIDGSGTKRSLSFRDLAHLCIVDETSIQADRSPIETGESVRTVAERSVFRLLLTGRDDSALTSILKPKDFQTARSAKLEIIDDMLKVVENELAEDFPHSADLPDQETRIEVSLAKAREEVDVARLSVRSLVDDKRTRANAILAVRSRLSEIAINLSRFEQLSEVYASDVQRLESLEEAGFLLLLGTDRDCPLCGASPAAQKHTHGVTEIEAARAAALAEVAKVRQQAAALSSTVQQLLDEQSGLLARLEEENHALEAVEAEIVRLTPQADETQANFDELLRIRDSVRYGLGLLKRRESLLAWQAELASMRRSTESKPILAVQSSAAHSFAQFAASVLEQWEFPGDLITVFDEAAYDLKVDGKNRRDNGKGVRAILHAAFKISLLLYCRDNDLPHPGFLILDSPLVTYRDPMTSKGGELTNDEAALRASTLKEGFFRHLHAIRDVAQVIILENVDPPPAIETIANVHIFTGRADGGRRGLL